jgi:hypothetical protein
MYCVLVTCLRQFPQVGDQYFQVHFHIFAVQSEKARDLLSARLHHPQHLVILENVTPIEFEKFLTVMYCKYVSLLVFVSLY